jgi:hypothetical protein
VQTEDVPIVLDGEKKRTERLLVNFAVEEAFIGVSEKTVTVSSGGDMCGFPFSKGHEYLVYARRLPNVELYVSTCYGTNFTEHAAGDLKYLRGSLPLLMARQSSVQHFDIQNPWGKSFNSDMLSQRQGIKSK